MSGHSLMAKTERGRGRVNTHTHEYIYFFKSNRVIRIHSLFSDPLAFLGTLIFCRTHCHLIVFCPPNCGSISPPTIIYRAQIKHARISVKEHQSTHNKASTLIFPVVKRAKQRSNSFECSHLFLRSMRLSTTFTFVPSWRRRTTIRRTSTRHPSSESDKSDDRLELHWPKMSRSKDCRKGEDKGMVLSESEDEGMVLYE